LSRYDAVNAYEADVTVPSIFEALTYDAVCAYEAVPVKSPINEPVNEPVL
jgi:hypothetical protein